LFGVAATAAGAISAVVVAVGSLVLSADATAVDAAVAEAVRKTAKAVGATASTDEVEASTDDEGALLFGRTMLALAVARRAGIGAASAGKTVRGSLVDIVAVDVSMSAEVAEFVVEAASLAELNVAAVVVAAPFADTWNAVAVVFG
jgi:hypothetical protein